MAASRPELALEEPIVRDVLDLARHHDKLSQVVEAVSELPAGTGFTAISKHVAEKIGLDQEEADGILTALQNLHRTRNRMDLEPVQKVAQEDEWLAERLRHATLTLREVVAIDPDVRGGIPVLLGTRFTLAQLLAELAEDRSVGQIAAAFRLDKKQIEKVLESFANYLDRPLQP
jgi:uncharacterized protein (DUF433 family)